MCYGCVVVVLTANGEHQEAEKLHRPLTAQAEKLAAEFPAQPWCRKLAAHVWRERAVLLRGIGRLEEASEALHRALEIQEQALREFPGNWGLRWHLSLIHVEVGLLLKQQGELLEAEQRLRKGIALLEELMAERPLHIEPQRNMHIFHFYYSLADILTQTKRLEEATQVFRRAVDAAGKAVALAPEDPIHRHRLVQQQFRLANALQASGLDEQAGEVWRDTLEAIAEGLQSNPDNAQLLALRGNSYARRGDWQQAGDDYAKAIQLEPERGAWYAGRAEARLALGRYDEALADCNRYVELSPNDPNAALIREQMLLLAGRTEEYRQARAQMLDRFGKPDNPLGVYLAARTCTLAPEAVSDPTAAVELAEQALAALPTHPWVLHCLGMAHFRAGQLDEAAQRFHESLRKDPSWESRYLNWLGLALVHHGRGETEGTRQWLGRAAELMERDSGPAPQDRIEGRLLRREVEQLLGKPEEKDD
jgi:tetratricopeptide (TPR) repeat protein